MYEEQPFMIKTLVLQSHRTPLPAQWINRCISSVKNWATQYQFDYLFIGDELYGYVPKSLLKKTKAQPIIATDLARLRALQFYLKQGFDRVIWCDADFLIFAPDNFLLPDEPYALGREIWVQNDRKKTTKLNVYIKVHNAFMLYCKNNSFLDFYADTAERLLTLNQGQMPPQFIGPKLLTAIHNIAQCPVLETAGMLSPRVIQDLANGTTSALSLMKQRATQSIFAANLCSSLYAKAEFNEQQIQQCIDKLLQQQTF